MSEELLNDAIRELEKDELLLEKVSEMLEAEAQMNAAKHMAERVLPNPLAVAVSNRLGNLNTAINHLKLRQERLFQPEDKAPPFDTHLYPTSTNRAETLGFE